MARGKGEVIRMPSGFVERRCNGERGYDDGSCANEEARGWLGEGRHRGGC